MRKSLLSAIVAAAALTLASCAMPADDPNFNANAELGGEEGEALASAAAADQAAMQAAFAPPTSIGVDTPLTTAPESGLTIVSLTDGTEYQGVFETSLAEAAAVLGWTVESVVVSPADPAAAATAFDEAVAAGPAGIHITGGLTDALAASLPAAETAGIPVICTGCSEGVPGVTDASINGTAQNTEWGKVLASYVLDNQYDGEDAGVQVFALPGGAYSDFNLQFSTTLIEQCRNCSATESIVDPAFTDLTDPVAVADFVVMEMSTALGSWALLDSGSLSTGVADALATDPTLLSPAVVIGRGANAADIESLKALGGIGPDLAGAGSGAEEASPAASPEAEAVEEEAVEEEAVEGEGDVVIAGRSPEEAAALQAWIAVAQPVMAWRVVDQFARIIGGEEPATGPVPSQLLTGSNVADAVLDDAGNYIGIADYQEQFAALWGVQ